MRLWLPYTQMQTAGTLPKVVRSAGATLTLADGRTLIDGIASWWTACHGYNHPAIVHAIQAQLEKFPHVMLGGLVHDPALDLSRKLIDLLAPPLAHVFFSESGSVAVEVALKMAIQYWQNKGEPEHQQFVYFKGSYHGDTLGCMAISDCPEFHHHFQTVLPKHHCASLPINDTLRQQFSDLLEKNHHTIAAVIIEPLVQGASGMQLHSPEVLQWIADICKKTNTLLIFDEIFTGFGRTGTLFAYEQAGVVPDMICLGKGLTGGHLPLAATVASSMIYNEFLSDDSSQAFMHGPTYTGHALACAAALASLELFETTDHLARANRLGAWFLGRLNHWCTHPSIRSIQALGAIFVISLHPGQVSVSKLRQAFASHPVWIRPLESCIYLTPAFTLTDVEMEQLATAIDQVLEQVIN
jgi:adenosylmethionine-8-amino-7-oxononanoate aminotransferase